ncbi:MAG: hypothetical protein ACP5NZ_02655 [Nanobdellota archaeon]
MRKIIKYALLNALGTSLYIILVASLLYSLSNGFLGNNNTIFIPIAMLMLFVFSAAFTGSLVFGRPIIWYLDGKKREALSLLAYTLCFFFFITLLVFLLLILLLG